MACEKNKDTCVNLPKGYTIDVDQDGNDDYKIYYSNFGAEYGCTEAAYVGPVDSNKVLNKSSHKLFLERGDTIYSEYTDPRFNWDDSGVTLMYNQVRYFQEPEETAWIPNSDHPFGHFVGIKIKRDENVKIGWMLFHLSRDDGQVILLDAKITEEDWIVIQ